MPNDMSPYFTSGALKELLNQYKLMGENNMKQGANAGLNLGQMLATSQNRDKDFLSRLGEVIPKLQGQQTQMQQDQSNWMDQFGLQKSGQEFSQANQLRQAMEQIRQFNEQLGVQKDSNSINNERLHQQQEANRYEQGQGTYMKLLGGLVGMGLTPATGGSGWLLNLLSKLVPADTSNTGGK